MRDAEALDKLPVHVAQMLLGKLSFVLRSGVFGACGRAASQPFFCRAHPLDDPNDVLNQEISRSGHNFTHAMRKASRFYDTLFDNLQPRRHPLGAHPRGKVVVYTDAQFDPSRAGLGVVIFDCDGGGPHNAFVTGGQVPQELMQWFQQRKTQINGLEILAILAAILSYPDMFRESETGTCSSSLTIRLPSKWR